MQDYRKLAGRQLASGRPLSKAKDSIRKYLLAEDSLKFYETIRAAYTAAYPVDREMVDTEKSQYLLNNPEKAVTIGIQEYPMITIDYGDAPVIYTDYRDEVRVTTAEVSATFNSKGVELTPAVAEVTEMVRPYTVCTVTDDDIQAVLIKMPEYRALGPIMTELDIMVAKGEKVVEAHVQSAIDEYNTNNFVHFSSVDSCSKYTLLNDYNHVDFCRAIIGFNAECWMLARKAMTAGSITTRTTSAEFKNMLPTFNTVQVSTQDSPATVVATMEEVEIIVEGEHLNDVHMITCTPYLDENLAKNSWAGDMHDGVKRKLTFKYQVGLADEHIGDQYPSMMQESHDDSGMTQMFFTSESHVTGYTIKELVGTGAAMIGHHDSTTNEFYLEPVV